MIEGADWEFDGADWEFDGAGWEFDGARPDIRANRRTRRDGRNLCEKKKRNERLPCHNHGGSSVSEVRRETHVRRSLNARRSSQVQVRSQLVEDSPTDAPLAGDSWSGPSQPFRITGNTLRPKSRSLLPDSRCHAHA